MADTKISALTASTVPLAGTEVLPIVQNGTTKQVSVANLTAGRTVAASNLAIGTGASAAGFSTTIAINRSGGGTRGILFQDGGSDQSGLYTDSGATGPLYIFSNGTRPISLSVNGAESLNLDTSNNVKVTAGNLIQGTAAKGVDFTANTPAAGMTSQLLNWYEEGTWTPIDSSGAGLTLTVTSARYTRVGRQVTCMANLAYPATASGASAVIGGLPFASNATFGGGAIQGFFSTRTFTISSNGLYGGSSATTVNIDKNNGTAVATNADVSGSGMYFTLTYFV